MVFNNQPPPGHHFSEKGGDSLFEGKTNFGTYGRFLKKFKSGHGMCGRCIVVCARFVVTMYFR